ncbi:MAG: hydantoinase B/oxoprolinase family protein, partial [Chloroflexi bacterium]|nr:hydantoinase B/oxoprolinase family protein [Chloroflexota bacterium]
MATDVITQEVIRARLDGIVREMQAAVLRTGYSTIIRESHDFSAGITDREGNVVGQHSPLPTHLGAYPDCVRGVLEFYDVEDMREGDCFLTNHPYHSGCPHPSDMVVVMPVFAGDEVIAFCASMGHKVDIGGQSPGSRNAIARDLFGEGLSILPVQFMRQRVL